MYFLKAILNGCNALFVLKKQIYRLHFQVIRIHFERKIHSESKITYTSIKNLMYFEKKIDKNSNINI